MLFVLTGDVQIGKTRWLETLTRDLQAEGTTCYGVLAPGVWHPRDELQSRSASSDPWEKLGIDNVLLPDGERLSFARRVDLAHREGTYDAGSQSAQAHLKWEISDKAIAQVNRHFEALRTRVAADDGGQLLVVDELGQLELLRGGGLTSAVALLDEGSCACFPHALAVVRDQLVPYAVKRFAWKWGGAKLIGPNEEGACLVRAAYMPEG